MLHIFYHNIYNIFSYSFIQNCLQIFTLMLPRLHLFEQKYSKNSNIMKYYYHFIELFSILMYFKM